MLEAWSRPQTSEYISDRRELLYAGVNISVIQVVRNQIYFCFRPPSLLSIQAASWLSGRQPRKKFQIIALCYDRRPSFVKMRRLEVIQILNGWFFHPQFRFYPIRAEQGSRTASSQRAGKCSCNAISVSWAIFHRGLCILHILYF